MEEGEENEQEAYTKREQEKEEEEERWELTENEVKKKGKQYR